MWELVKCSTIDEYRTHYENKYCIKPTITFDNIPVYFNKNRFDHDFFESSKRDKIKDQFSFIRAERIDWIEKTLKDKSAVLYQGWDSKKKRYDNSSRVSIVCKDYVVVIRISRKQNGQLKANFVTAYVADNSINKITCGPLWKNII